MATSFETIVTDYESLLRKGTNEGYSYEDILCFLAEAKNFLAGIGNKEEADAVRRIISGLEAYHDLSCGLSKPKETHDISHAA